MKDDIIIKANGVNKYFGSFHALKDISLSISRGDIYGFIGKNGAGKTTFMRILCGLMKPTSGYIEVLDNNIKSNTIESKNRGICFLPQNVRFKDEISTEDVVRFFGKLKDVDCAESFDLIKELDIDMKRKVKELSPGNQRKVQLIIAIMGNPDILVLDEPTAGLDPIAVQQVREIIRNLNKKGCTIFISSHVLTELDNLCENVAVIENGNILFQGQCTNAYEIEIQGKDEHIKNLLAYIKQIKYSSKESKIYVGIKKQEVPELLQKLYEKNIKVFSVKPQGLELLYNDYIGGKDHE